MVSYYLHSLEHFFDALGRVDLAVVTSRHNPNTHKQILKLNRQTFGALSANY